MVTKLPFISQVAFQNKNIAGGTYHQIALYDENTLIGDVITDSTVGLYSDGVLNLNGNTLTTPGVVSYTTPEIVNLGGGTLDVGINGLKSNGTSLTINGGGTITVEGDLDFSSGG